MSWFSTVFRRWPGADRQARGRQRCGQRRGPQVGPRSPAEFTSATTTHPTPCSARGTPPPTALPAAARPGVGLA